MDVGAAYVYISPTASRSIAAWQARAGSADEQDSRALRDGEAERPAGCKGHGRGTTPRISPQEGPSLPQPQPPLTSRARGSLRRGRRSVPIAPLPQAGPSLPEAGIAPLPQAGPPFSPRALRSLPPAAAGTPQPLPPFPPAARA